MPKLCGKLFVVVVVIAVSWWKVRYKLEKKRATFSNCGSEWGKLDYDSVWKMIFLFCIQIMTLLSLSRLTFDSEVK